MSETLQRLIDADDTIQMVAGEAICRSNGQNVSLGRLKHGVFLPTRSGEARLVAMGKEQPKAKPKAARRKKAGLQAAPKVEADSSTVDAQLELALGDDVKADEKLGG